MESLFHLSFLEVGCVCICLYLSVLYNLISCTFVFLFIDITLLSLNFKFKKFNFIFNGKSRQRLCLLRFFVFLTFRLFGRKTLNRLEIAVYLCLNYAS